MRKWPRRVESQYTIANDIKCGLRFKRAWRPKTLKRGRYPFRKRGRYPFRLRFIQQSRCANVPRMPRLARAVCALVPHHITQRGNRREDVFFTDEDRQAYLGWLRDYAKKSDVEVLAYCLMSNHVHLVAVPKTEEGLQWALKPLHMRYAQRINRARGWKGHLWQGRFFSSALDDEYLWAAIRYVERNPVRAKLVRKAENYPWSSAAAHCGLRADPVLTDSTSWRRRFDGIGNWSAWLAEGDEPVKLDILRRNADKGLPCGGAKFIHKLERISGRLLRYRPIGRPTRGKKRVASPL
jgi:putative transposase